MVCVCRGSSTGLDAGQYFFHPAIVAICWHEQTTQGVMSTAMVVPMEMGAETALHFRQIIEVVYVEQLFLQVAIEHLQLPICLLRSSNLLDIHLLQQLGVP